LTRGFLVNDEEKESQRITLGEKALWFHPSSGQSVKYCIRVTQDNIDRGQVNIVGKGKPSEMFEVVPEEQTRKINWRKDDSEK
jgi:hypothetical protein